jgi:hypothetical protein
MNSGGIKMDNRNLPRKKKPTALAMPTTSASVSSPVKPPLNITHVRPGLFMSGYEATKNLADLNANSITHILNLTGEVKCPNLHEGPIYENLLIPDNAKVDILFFIYVALDYIEKVL